jgi:hypothetical protein
LWDRENKRREMLMFEVASFDIGYNYILGRPFLLRFMTVIHTAYATIKMSGPRGVITLKSDQRDTLACENAALTHTGRFSKKEVQNLAAKVAKTHGGGTSVRTVMLRPLAGDTPKMSVARKAQRLPPHQPSASSIGWWPMRGRELQTRRFRWTLVMLTKSFISVRS